MPKKYKHWMKKEDGIICELWPEAPMDEIIKKLPDRNYMSIKERAKLLKVKRDPKFCKAARFKPKRVYKHINEGVVTIVNYNGHDYCTLNKNGKQILFHRFLWEKKYGPIPEGMVLRCKTDNTANPNPDNWECTTPGEIALKNVDRKKAIQALNTWAEKHGGRPAQVLTDNMVASILSNGDKNLRNYILKNEKEMIKVARLNYILKREITHASNQK